VRCFLSRQCRAPERNEERGAGEDIAVHYILGGIAGYFAELTGK
jgi:hypothetical protein